MGVWVGLTMFGGGFVGLGWVSPGLGRVCSLVSPTLRTRLLYECLLYFCFTYTFLCLTSDAHEARRPSFCNALDKLLRIGCWRSDAHSRGSENENP